MFNTKSRKLTGKITAVILSVLMVFTMFPMSVTAAEKNTPKEEVVYVNLNTDGSVREIVVVNIFDLADDGTIIDYGEYQTVRNMTTTDKVNYSDNKVSIDAKEGKLYYEGTLDSNVMPWNIDIKYYIDDIEYTAEEIAGMSGSLKISMSVRQNKNCNGNFFDGYALQTSFILDTDKCKNIITENATIANVGSDKQLTYTILPGKETDITITADVTDFEMDGISVNGVPLSLNIEIDESEITDRVSELTDGVQKIDDGVSEVQNGVSDLRNGVEDNLQSGINDFADGASQLQDSAYELQNGGSDLNDGAKNLQNGAENLDSGVTLLNDGISQIQSALNTLNNQSSSLTSGSAQVRSVLQEIQTALSNVSVSTDNLSELTNASSAIKNGIENLVNGVSELQQSVSFQSYKALMNENGLNIDELKEKNSLTISNLQDTVSDLNQSITVMKKLGIGTEQLEEQVVQFENIIMLLNANNANIDGTEEYLNEVNKNITQLLEGIK